MLELAGGGVVGVVAGIASQIIKGRSERKMADIRLKVIDAERKSSEAAATEQSEISAIQGHYGLRQEQEKTAQAVAANTYKWINGVRSLVRPGLTVFAMTLGAIVEDPAKVEQYTTMGSMAFAWWFTERAISSKGDK